MLVQSACKRCHSYPPQSVYRASGCRFSGVRGCQLYSSSSTPSQAKHHTITCKGGHSSGKPSRRKARQPGLFEVQVVSPPEKSLGIHPFAPNTHNGDLISVAGKDYVVEAVVLQYQLVRGKYQRDHKKLEVQQSSRYFLNMHLEQLYRDKSCEPKQQ